MTMVQIPCNFSVVFIYTSILLQEKILQLVENYIVEEHTQNYDLLY